MISRRGVLLGAAAGVAGVLLGGEAGAAALLVRGKDPSVIYHNGNYLMYYSVPPTSTSPLWGQAVAISSDLDSWRYVRTIKRGICAGDGIVLADGRVHLFYQTYRPGVVSGICHASSADGVNFTISTSPIFRPSGSWTNGRAIDAEARLVGDDLFVYWATRDPSGMVQMVGAHSRPRDGGSWRQRCGGPMLRPELGWEGRCIEAPSIAGRGKVLVMFYAGNYNARLVDGVVVPQQIGVAYSFDGGLSWERGSDRPFLPNGPAGSWNADESGHPGVFYDPRTGLTWLFFQGTNDGGRTYWISKRRIYWDGYRPSLTGG